jgi:hypothetical protein
MECGCGVINFFMEFTENPILAITLLVIASVIDLILRGFALWHSARRGQNVWFVFLLIINSVGILPIIYLLTNRKK